MVALASAGVTARAEPPDVGGDVTRTLAGETVIHLSFVTSAPPEKIWKALTNPEELTKWVAPQVKVELKPGGVYEYYLKPNRPFGKRGMEGTRVMNYVPGKILTHSGPLPDSWVIWTIEPAGDQQAVHYYALGTSSDWNDTAYARQPLALELVEKLAKYLQP